MFECDLLGCQLCLASVLDPVSLSSPLEAYEGLDVREQQRSDTESIEKASLGSSRTETESSHSTPSMQR